MVTDIREPDPLGIQRQFRRDKANEDIIAALVEYRAVLVEDNDGKEEIDPEDEFLGQEIIYVDNLLDHFGYEPEEEQEQ